MYKKCLKCGYARKPSDIAPDYECPKCGAIYDKVDNMINKKTSDSVVNKKMNSVKKDNWISQINNFFDFSQPITSKKSILIMILIFLPALLYGIFSDNTGSDQGMWMWRKISEMDIIDWIIIIIVFGVVIGITKIVITSKKKKSMEEKLYQLKNFSPTQKVMGEDGKSGLAIDEKLKKICLIKQKHGVIHIITISYKDLLSSEIYEDGVTITKTARTSQLGGALIGGIALGGVGAILGGLSGKKTSTDKVNRIDLRITVNKTDAPVHDVNFMNVEGKRGGLIYNNVIQQARHWHGLIKVLIRRADEEDKSKENNCKIKEVGNKSVADELMKLAQLKGKGILSESEFEEQKTKLLSKN